MFQVETFTDFAHYSSVKIKNNRWSFVLLINNSTVACKKLKNFMYKINSLITYFLTMICNRFYGWSRCWGWGHCQKRSQDGNSRGVCQSSQVYCDNWWFLRSRELWDVWKGLQVKFLNQLWKNENLWSHWMQKCLVFDLTIFWVESYLKRWTLCKYLINVFSLSFSYR